MTAFHIRPARSLTEIREVTKLFAAYADSLGIDLSYQDFTAELASMPGKYAPPFGELLIACDAKSRFIGCVGLRAMEPKGLCEMKRLYVAPEGRGLGIGKALVDRIVEKAIAIGYKEMYLDTLPSMVQAIALYKDAGFEVIPPYYDTPLSNTIFLGRAL